MLPPWEETPSRTITSNNTKDVYTSCNCIGPQNNEPKCPCMMRGVIERDGRWVETERDLGPVLKSLFVPTQEDGS